ncbi:MAG: Gfo/Idh/MocA family protein [Armatimonadota bacterium]
MNRRDLLAGSAGLALTSAAGRAAYSEELADRKHRVGLIGTGWYGKADLLRLIQVAPVEVVSLCDVDRQMLSEAADLVATRQASKKKPRTYGDYREMLKEKDLDLVLIATPDHWHALPMIAAVQSGADVYVQKPISVDVVEGQAMVAAARKHGRVVQVGTQRRSTPHLVDARNSIVKAGKLGKVAMAEVYCYYHMRARENAPDTTPPANLDYEMWTGPAPMRPYNRLVHPRSWRAFMEYGNGIVGDMCIHMLDMVRWMLDLGWPTEVTSMGGIMMDPNSKANISDTQTASFDFGDTKMIWQHRTWGRPNDPDYPWGATLYGDKGTLKLSVNGYDFIPMQGAPVHKDVTMELDQYPEDRTEKDLERHVAPAIRHHMIDWLRNVESRGKPVADIEQGHISTTACILANMSMQLGRGLRWDPVKQRVIGDDEANRLLRRPYRKPWVHPEPNKV